jgi:hypothetical protein
MDRIGDGNDNCRVRRNHGFDYSGTVSLSVQAGDTYGFAMRGSNFDEIETLQGTLTVNDTPEQKISDLQDLVASMGIHHGITNALEHKLQNALDALAADDTAGAVTGCSRSSTW